MRRAQALLGNCDLETIRYEILECSLGHVLVGASSRGICCVLLGEDALALEADFQARFPQARLENAAVNGVRLILATIEDPRTTMSLPLDARGTEFQKKVWRELGRIPVGKSASYAELASALGSPKAARAVASACAAIPLAVLIPCHRVIRRDGGISGYRWGVMRKSALLVREQQDGSNDTPRNSGAGTA
jgi:AraC family transcriptional regulator of adaptative response/methylated-DNA-[protein]-cysteine methyltransferase